MPLPEKKSSFNDYKWQTSSISSFMQQAIIPVTEDIELCVEVGGHPNNPPLLLIMGLGSQMIFWPDSFLSRLIDAGFYVIRFDNRDIGLSSKIKREHETQINTLAAMIKLQVGLDNSNIGAAYTVEDMADDTASLIKALGLKQPHILGASMGGIIAQILAAKYPHLVNRLALIFSTNNRPFLLPPYPKQLYTLIRKPSSYAEKDMIEYGEWFINTVGSQGYIDKKAVTHIAKLRYQRCFYPQGSLQQLTAILMTGSIQSYSKEIKTPTLILHGTKDRLLPASHGRVLANNIPNAIFVPIKGMAHDLPDYFQPFIVAQLHRHMLAH